MGPPPTPVRLSLPLLALLALAACSQEPEPEPPPNPFVQDEFEAAEIARGVAGAVLDTFEAAHGARPVVREGGTDYAEIVRALEDGDRALDGVAVEGCTPPAASEDPAGWLVRCVYSARDATGAPVREEGTFVIRDGVAVHIE